MTKNRMPALAEPHSSREESLLNLSNPREYAPLPEWKTFASVDGVSDGLAEVSLLLQKRSLVEIVPATDTQRMRVHPLVSEFAAERLSSDDRFSVVLAQSRFYLTRLTSNRAYLDADEKNIEHSVNFAIKDWPFKKLLLADELAGVAGALQYRGRYQLMVACTEAHVDQATRYGSDQDSGAAWILHATALYECGRTLESMAAVNRGRLLLERASIADRLIGSNTDHLWWAWSNDHRMRDEDPSCALK
ncbi:MAG: hypothetical protein IPP90_15390 [Gemmatimonadaceae bacterium]|nr:hypothetical protein [Gemmatimonadaceae bacterium]